MNKTRIKTRSLKRGGFEYLVQKRFLFWWYTVTFINLEKGCIEHKARYADLNTAEKHLRILKASVGELV